LLTWAPIDLDAVNVYFGTALRSTDFTALTASSRLRAVVDRLPVPVATLKASILRQRARPMCDYFDLVMSASNEADFGRPGIQYIHYPVRHASPLPVDQRWYHRRWSLHLYEWICSTVSSFDDQAMCTNLTLVNSAWTGNLVSRIHGIPVRVVHPPAAGVFPDVPWHARDDGFLCIGRLTPQKEIERVVEIVGRVRSAGADVHLHIVGEDEHRAYARRVRDMARRAGPWVTVEGTLAMPDLERLMTTHRYVIHGMREEHFGMGVAQGLRAGCI